MRVHMYAYDLSLQEPLPVLKEFATQRKGFILVLYDHHEAVAFSEVAPLPGLSHETLDLAKKDLDKAFSSAFIKSLLRQGMSSFLNAGLLRYDSFFAEHVKSIKVFQDYAPSVKWGLSGLAVSKLRLKEKVSVRTHALINLQKGNEAIAEAIKLSQSGFSTIKVKVNSQDLDYQSDLINEILSQTDLLVRIDANRGLELKQSLKLLKGLELGRIDYIEEPLQEVSLNSLVEIRKETGIRVALDETLTDVNFKSVMSDYKNEFVAILKPTVLGSYWEIMALIKKLAPLKTVMSSCYESPVGISQIALFSQQFADTDIGVGHYFSSQKHASAPTLSGPVLTNKHKDLLQFVRSLQEVRTYELN